MHSVPIIHGMTIGEYSLMFGFALTPYLKVLSILERPTPNTEKLTPQELLSDISIKKYNISLSSAFPQQRSVTK